MLDDRRRLPFTSPFLIPLLLGHEASIKRQASSALQIRRLDRWISLDEITLRLDDDRGSEGANNSSQRKPMIRGGWNSRGIAVAVGTRLVALGYGRLLSAVGFCTMP